MNRKGFISLMALTLYASLSFAQPVLDSVCISDAPSRFAVPYQNDVKYKWSVGQGQIIGAQDSNVVVVDWSLANVGRNRISVYAYTEGQICPPDTSVATILISGKRPALALYPNKVCQGDSVFVESTVGGNFKWQGGAKTRIFGFKATRDTSFYLVALNHPCDNDTVFINIAVEDQPVAQIGPLSDTAYFNSELILFYPRDTQNLEVEWFIDGQYFNSGKRVVLPLDQFGPIEIMQVVNNGICEDSVVKWIYVDELFKVFFPSAFTPNGDGLNERWLFKGVGIVSFDALIFNRWGEMVYQWNESSDPLGWNGTNAGQNSPQGSYTYKVEIWDERGQVHYYSGFFSLIR